MVHWILRLLDCRDFAMLDTWDSRKLHNSRIDVPPINEKIVVKGHWLAIGFPLWGQRADNTIFAWVLALGPSLARLFCCESVLLGSDNPLGSLLANLFWLGHRWCIFSSLCWCSWLFAILWAYPLFCRYYPLVCGAFWRGRVYMLMTLLQLCLL